MIVFNATGVPIVVKLMLFKYNYSITITVLIRKLEPLLHTKWPT